MVRKYKLYLMSPQKPLHTALPSDLRPLLWSYRSGDLEVHQDAKTIIVHLMNYGNLTHWRWLNREFGAEEVRQVIAIDSGDGDQVEDSRGCIAPFFHTTWRHTHRAIH
jgi:hypothetical protein